MSVAISAGFASCNLDARRTAYFEQLVVEYAPYIMNICFRMTRHWEEAEDLTQEVFERAFKGFRNFRPGTNFKAWIFKISLNAFITNLRKEKKKPRIYSFDDPDVDDLITKGVEWSEGLEKTVFRRLASEKLQEAFNKLPEKFKPSILLRDVEDLRYKEIARILGIPLGTVRSRILSVLSFLIGGEKDGREGESS